MLIRNYGLFWTEEDVFWGKGSVAGTLLGVPVSNVTAEPTDFREQAGVYLLYADYQLVYVGKAGSGNQKLFSRLKQHRRDALAKRWNQFSWFGTRTVLASGTLRAAPQVIQIQHGRLLDHIEAILIHAAEPRQNRQGGRFGNAEQYVQYRDDSLGPNWKTWYMRCGSQNTVINARPSWDVLSLGKAPGLSAETERQFGGAVRVASESPTGKTVPCQARPIYANR